MRGQKRAVKSIRSRGDKIRTGKGPKEKAVGEPRTRVPGSETPPTPTAPLTPPRGQRTVAHGPGERGRKDLSFTLTYMQASPSRKAKEDMGQGGGRGFLLTSVGSHGQHLGDRQ